jgi:hypothetical protein
MTSPIYTQTTIGRVKTMLDTGLTNKEIAATIGTTEASLAVRISQLGLSRNPEGFGVRWAVVRKPPGEESAEDDVVTMTRALWRRFDRAMFVQRLVYSPWFSRPGSQALRCLDCAGFRTPA